MDTLLRSLVLGQLGLYGDEGVVAEARKRLTAHVAHTTTLPADLRSPVYKTVVAQADEKTFEQMLKVKKQHTSFFNTISYIPGYYIIRT